METNHNRQVDSHQIIVEGDANLEDEAWVIAELEALVQNGEEDQTFLPLTKKDETDRIKKILKGDVKIMLDIRPRSRRDLWNRHLRRMAYVYLKGKKDTKSLDINEKVLYLLLLSWGFAFAYIPGYGIRLCESDRQYWKPLQDEVLNQKVLDLLQQGKGLFFNQKEKERVTDGRFLSGWVKWYKSCYPFFFSKSVNGGLLAEEEIQRDCLVSTPDGVIDLQTVSFLEPDPSLLVMRSLDRRLEATSMTEQVNTYFFQLGGWNPVVINLLRATIKIAAMPGRFKKLSIIPSFYSQGGTGKTTFVKLLERIRGVEAIRIAIENLTGSTFSKQSMVGKKLVLFDEISPASLTSSRLTLLKTMISGDPVQVEVKYKDPESIEGIQLVMVGNHPFNNGLAPEALEDTGWRRRNLCMRCESPYGLLPKDDSINDKVMGELHVILSWALALSDSLIFKLGHNAGLVSEYSEINSITPPYGLAIKQWLSNHVRLDRGSTTLCGYVGSPKAGSLNLAFNEYCEENEIAIPKSRSAFKSNLERSLREFELDRSKGIYGRKEKSGWVIHGLSLDKKKGEKILFPEPEVWTELANHPVLTSLDKDGVVIPIQYKNNSSNEAIKPPEFHVKKRRSGREGDKPGPSSPVSRNTEQEQEGSTLSSPVSINTEQEQEQEQEQEGSTLPSPVSRNTEQEQEGSTLSSPVSINTEQEQEQEGSTLPSPVSINTEQEQEILLVNAEAIHKKDVKSVSEV